MNGPAMDARGSFVAAAWFTAAGGSPRVRAAVSADGGGSFGPALDVDVGASGEPLGRVDVAVGEAGSAVVSWLRKGGGDGEIVVRRLGADGRMGPEVVIGRTSAGRASGFPKVAAWQDGYVAAWTVPGDSPRLEAVRLAEAAVPAVE